MAEKRFVKGLFKDTGHIDQPESSWRHAKNMVINQKDGAISNEGGTELSGHLGETPHIGAQNDKVIGAIEVNDDKVILFITDIVTVDAPPATAPRSEIGIWEKGVYIPLFNPDLLAPGQLTNDLNFRQTYPIEGTFKIDPKGDLIVYWTDDLNPPRAFNVDRQIRESGGGNINAIVLSQLYGITSSNLDNIDILNLFPYSGPVPHVELDDQGTHQGSIIEGGGLLTAAYYLSLAYVDDDFVSTNFLTVSNPISIVDEFDATVPTNKKDGAKEGSQTTKAIKWEISNLNINYKFLRPVVVRKKGDATEAFRLNDVEIITKTTVVVFSGIEGVSPASVDDIIIDTISYDTVKTMQQLDNVLYLGNITSSEDLGYQKYANNIKLRARVDSIDPFDQFYASVDNLETGWGTFPVNDFGGTVQTVDPTKSYRYVPNIFKWKGYMRDEIYAFYIAFIMKDGSMSYAYHIPGREDLEFEKDPVNTLDATDYGGLWGTDIYNISPKYGKRFHWIDSTVSSISNFAYNAVTYMNMNYWENATEFYPDTDNYEVWDGVTQLDDLKGLNVRHHHFPSNANDDMRSILDDSQCRTEVSSGSSVLTPAWNDTLIMIDGRWAGSTDGYHTWYLCCGNWTRNRFNMGIQTPPTACPPTNANANTNDPAMQTALWDAVTDTFTADQDMTVTVRWHVSHRQSGVTDPSGDILTRLRSSLAVNAFVATTECSDFDGNPVQWTNGGTATSGSYNGTCGHGSTNCGCGISGQMWIGYNSNLASCPAGTIINMTAGDTLWLESSKATSPGSPMGQTGFDYYCNLCAGWRNYSYFEFVVVAGAATVDPDDLHDAKISHHVQRLGFDLEDIKIPQSIADQVQGFRVYYAKRSHADRTVLGQGPLLPAMYRRAKIGMCSEAGSSAEAAQVLGNLQDAPEEFYNMDPWPSAFWNYAEADHYVETGADITPTNNSVGPLQTGHIHNTFKFHDFYLLRTKNSLSLATHISAQYRVKNLAWNGSGLDQDKKMTTILTDPGGSTPITVKEVWGWNADQNCYPQKMRTAIFMGVDYVQPAKRTQPRLLGQKAKTYLLGDTIFKGDALGFGGKLFNEFGESAIAFKLMDDHAFDADQLRSYPNSDTVGYFADTYGPPPAPELVYGHYGRPHSGFSTLVNTLDAAGDFSNSGAHGYRSQTLIANLKAFKTDVYKSIDSQELVWTGFEVLGDDLNNYVFNSVGTMGGTGKTLTTHPDGIYGGDTFICRYGVASSLKPSNSEDTSEPKKAIHYHIVESTDNINFRHQEDDSSLYFPNNVAKIILRNIGPEDFSFVDNMKYDSNFSALNNIRPAFPLPLRDTIQTDFPTRTHRSAKADTTSLIDNWRIFLANQFKDLPKNRGDLWKLSSFNNLLYFHMEDTLFAAKGKQSMQMKDGSEAFVGSGDIFQQEPDELVQTEDGFGGTQSQYAALTTRHGYFFVDRESKKVFLMKDKLAEISNLGMETWFRENLNFELEKYGFTSTCSFDNPILGLGFHAIYDPKFKRIILTKRELKPTQSFIDGWNLPNGPGTAPCPNYVLNKIRFNSSKCIYQQWGPDKFGVCKWQTVPFECFESSKFTCEGWTISYYPETGVWGGFHDYIPYIYFNTSTDFYSLTTQYKRPAWTQGLTVLATHLGTTFGNAGIWKHNSNTNYGILYQEWSDAPTNITYAEWLSDTINYYSFEFEFIHNELKSQDSLVSSFNYTLETFNQAGISVLEHGFTSFLIYNTFQLSGVGNDWLDFNGDEQNDANGVPLTAADINTLEYLINVRRIGNNWKVNKFRDMAALVDQSGTLGVLNTSAYYTSTNTNIIGGTNIGTVTSSSTQDMFLYEGMHKVVNAPYLDLTKNWNLQRKFIDKWIGIRLIYTNITNNLLNLYSTNVETRKLHR